MVMVVVVVIVVVVCVMWQFHFFLAFEDEVEGVGGEVLVQTYEDFACYLCTCVISGFDVVEGNFAVGGIY